jgi:hypothetical protein
MSEDHQKYLEWNGDRFRKWADRIGINTYQAVDAILRAPNVWNNRATKAVWGFLSLRIIFCRAFGNVLSKGSLLHRSTQLQNGKVKKSKGI